MVGEEKDKQPYGYEVYEEYNWKALAKKIAKYVAIVAVIAAIGWLLYDYFAGSYVPIAINVKSLDGKPINDNSIYISNEKSGVVHLEKSSQPSYNFTLKRGLLGATENYVLKVEADGFKSQTLTLQVGTEKVSQAVQMEKDMEVRIRSIGMPKQLFGGQTFIMTATLENNGKKGEKIEFGFGKDLEEWGCFQADKEIFIQAGATADFNIQCTVPVKATSQISSKGVEKEAAVSIKMTKEQKTVKFNLYPKPNFTPAARLDFSGLDPVKSQKKRLDFKLQNSSKFPLYDIRLRIEIISSEKNSPDNVIKWVSFINSMEEDKTKITIPVIYEGKTHSEPVEIDIPVSALPEKITGRIVTEAPFLAAPIYSTLSLEITKSAQATIVLDYPEVIPIYFSDGIPESKIETITVKNAGDLDISNLNIVVKNPETCTENWLYFTDGGFITKIKAKESRDVFITASAPRLAKVGGYAPCILMASYPHPITGTMIEEDQGLLQVKRAR